MRLYDTLSENKKELPLDEIIKIYSCGPTVYGPIHLGNLRSLLIADLLHRVLLYLGYKVSFVRNFTDIDDKILKAAQENNQDPLKYSQYWLEEIKKKILEFNILPVLEVKVTDHVLDIIEFIQDLLQHNYAYESEGDVFFSVKNFHDYGKLSKKTDLIENFRIHLQEKKRDQKDFVLWKKDDHYGWNSPWSKGRPGWHIECSTLIKKHLGDTLHIHHGGQDLIFPHHENEIAQSECLTHKPLSLIWMHHAFVIMNEEKMSKSLGNVVDLDELQKKYSSSFLRFLFISNHYQDPIHWSASWVEEKKAMYDKIDLFLKEEGGNESFPLRLEEEFKEGLKDNLNIAKALSVVFEMISLANKDKKYSRLLIKNILETVFGLTFSKDIIPDFIQDLALLREEARKNKNYTEADRLRQEIESHGYEVLDSKEKIKIIKK